MRKLHIAPIIALSIILATVVHVVMEVRAKRECAEDSVDVLPTVPQEESLPVRTQPAKSHVREEKPDRVVRRTFASVVFRGFENPRYQCHDRLIQKLVDEFNANRKSWLGATSEQAAMVSTYDPVLLKAQMIQETGGNTVESRAAWAIDPAQINVPGDWTPYKLYLGLHKPRHRNEGSLEQNLRAAIKFLARKGFGASGQPAANRAEAKFDGWDVALRRYNGRVNKLADGTLYCDFYAARIMNRAYLPDVYQPIESVPAAKAALKIQRKVRR